MQLILLFALLGLGTGALIAGIALGVVLTYRGSGIINLATGAVAMVAGYSFWSLKTDEFGFTLGTAPALAKLVASVGILLTLQSTMLLSFGSSAKTLPDIFPSGSVTVYDVPIPVNRFWLTGIVVAIGIALIALYRWTRFGLATRAASENEVAGVLAGISPNQLSLANTVLGAVVAGAMGVLAAPLVQVDSTSLPLQIVPALAAAVFARFTSFA